MSAASRLHAGYRPDDVPSIASGTPRAPCMVIASLLLVWWPSMWVRVLGRRLFRANDRPLLDEP